MARFAAALFLVPVLLGAQDKTYELKFTWKPSAGAKVEIKESEVQNINVTVKQGETPLQAEKKKQGKTFEGTMEVVKVDGDKISESLTTWTKATRLEEGKDVAFGFQGKAVRMKRKDGKVEFTREDGAALEADEIEALKDVADEKDRKPGEPTADELLAPKKPVKVGESWSPNVKELASGMFKEMGDAIDAEKSKVTLTLKAVENQGGVDFGKVEGAFELIFSKIGPMDLEKPMTMKLTAEIFAAIDGRSPDGHMKMKPEMKGSSPLTTPDGQKLVFDVEIGGEMSKVRKSLK